MKVAFLANTYHLTKTRSSQFFIDLLKGWFGEVTVVAHQDVWARLPGTSWDLIVSWQHLFRPEEFEAFGARNTVIVPMYDDCPKQHEFWIRYKGFKILCFSRTLANLLEPWGLECYRVAFRPPLPDRQASFEEGLRGFFWPRTDALDWRHLGPLFSGVSWQRFHLHTAQTPSSAVLPTQEQLGASTFVQTEWFEHPKDYAQVLAKANVFIAPRRYEGIGMAVLEALALGQCVIAPNLPTANEYITPDHDGLLFDADKPEVLELSNAEALGRGARKSAQVGRDSWLASLPKLQSFLSEPPERPRVAPHPWIVFRGRSLALARAVFRRLKALSNRTGN